MMCSNVLKMSKVSLPLNGESCIKGYIYRIFYLISSQSYSRCINAEMIHWQVGKTGLEVWLYQASFHLFNVKCTPCTPIHIDIRCDIKLLYN